MNTPTTPTTHGTANGTGCLFGMFHPAVLTDARFTVTHFLVYLFYCLHANQSAGGVVWYAIDTLSRLIGRSTRHAIDCIHDLRDWGYLLKVGEGWNGTIKYQVLQRAEGVLHEAFMAKNAPPETKSGGGKTRIIVNGDTVLAQGVGEVGAQEGGEVGAHPSKRTEQEKKQTTAAAPESAVEEAVVVFSSPSTTATPAFEVAAAPAPSPTPIVAPIVTKATEVAPIHAPLPSQELLHIWPVILNSGAMPQKGEFVGPVQPQYVRVLQPLLVGIPDEDAIKIQDELSMRIENGTVRNVGAYARSLVAAHHRDAFTPTLTEDACRRANDAQVLAEMEDRRRDSARREAEIMVERGSMTPEQIRERLRAIRLANGLRS